MQDNPGETDTDAERHEREDGGGTGGGCQGNVRK